MINLNNIIETTFKEKVEILEEIKCGLRCETYLVKVRNEKYIFQIYIGSTSYQAKKKYNILNKCNSKFIPKAIKVEENREYSYLITEYIDGENLYYYRKTDYKFSLKNISNELAIVLGQVHNISYENKFGWIDNESVKGKDKLIDYIHLEYKRLSINLENIDLDIRESILNKVKKAMAIIRDKTENINKSCLCWYDMNPGNVLIREQDQEYKLKALIDPGGARYGVPEWDIAFIKMQLCMNKEEFDDFLAKYQKANPERIIDIELVEPMAVMGELDVISIEIEEDVIILPIP